MPTAGKLAGALIFAVLAYILAATYRLDYPRDTMPGGYYGIAMLIGLAVGWRVMGPRSQGRLIETANAGLLTAVITVLVTLLFFATREMLRRSLNELYSGPTEAVIGIFAIAAEYVTYMASLQFLGTLLVGGLICGALAGLVGRRWS